MSTLRRDTTASRYLQPSPENSLCSSLIKRLAVTQAAITLMLFIYVNRPEIIMI